MNVRVYKGWSLAFLALLLSVLAFTPALAHPTHANIKGQVGTVNPFGVLTVLTPQHTQEVIVIPGGFDKGAFQVGDSVLVKGIYQTDGAVLAVSVKKVNRVGGDAINGELENPYCQDGKIMEIHPIAIRLEELSAAKASWVMDHFCEGHSMGDILLALKIGETHQSGADLLLIQHAEGKEWGQIWEEAGWIDNSHEVTSPQGWLKRP